jgi:hypothetical protein
LRSRDDIRLVATASGANRHDPGAAPAPLEDACPSDQERKWQATSWDAAVARLPGSPGASDAPTPAEIPWIRGREGPRATTPPERDPGSTARRLTIGATLIAIGVAALLGAVALFGGSSGVGENDPGFSDAVGKTTFAFFVLMPLGIGLLGVGIWLIVSARRSASPYARYCSWCREGYHSQCTSSTCECQRHAHEPPPLQNREARPRSFH